MTLIWLFIACGDFSRDTGDSGTICKDPVTCPLDVSELSYTCGDSGLGGSRALTAENTESGVLVVFHSNFREGCCPDFGATANANRGDAKIDVAYSLTDDACDCNCELDLSYTLSGIRAGTWILAAGFDAVEVTVE